MDIGCLCNFPVVAIAADAAALMCEHHVGALAVVTNDDPPNGLGVVSDRDLALEVVGLVSFDDLVGAIADELTGLVRALRAGIARETEVRAVLSVPAARRLVYPKFRMRGGQ